MVRVWIDLLLCLTVRSCLNFGRRAIGSKAQATVIYARRLYAFCADYLRPAHLIVYLVGVRRAARVYSQVLRSNVVRLQRVTLRHSAAFVPPHASCSIGLSDGASELRALGDRLRRKDYGRWDGAGQDVRGRQHALGNCGRVSQGAKHLGGTRITKSRTKMSR